jgi:hypothetical protein
MWNAGRGRDMENDGDGITGHEFIWRPDKVFALQIKQRLIIDGKHRFINIVLPDYETCVELYKVLKEKIKDE